MSSILPSLCVALAAPALGAGPEQRPLVLDDLAALREVREATIDPHGSLVAFTLASTDPATNRIVTHLWIVPTNGGEARPFTHGAGSEWHPRFSEDGKSLAFLSNRDGTSSVWWIPTTGGEARRTSLSQHPVIDFAWSPDGSRFVVAAIDDSNEISGLARPGVRVAADRGLSHDSVGSRAHLFLVPIGGGEPRPLAPAVADDFDPTFTPDGKSVVFASNRSADAQHPSNTDLYVVATNVGEPRALTSTISMECTPAVSPDGKWVAYLACSGAAANDDALYVMPIEGGTPTNLSAASGLRVAGVHDAGGPRWSGDGATVYFGVIESGDTTIWAASRGSASPRRLVLGPGDNSSLCIASKGNRLVFVRSEIDQPSDVWIASLDAPDLRRLTDVNRTVLSTIRLAPCECVRVRGNDGAEVDAMVVRPATCDSGKRYPAVVCLPGACDRSYRAFSPMAQLLAASGYAVILAPAGRSAGDAAVAALDDAVERGLVDPDHVGLVGGVHAGPAALDLLATTSRFRAAVLGAGNDELSALAGKPVMRFSIDRPWRSERRATTAVLKDVVAPTLVLEIGADDPSWSIEVAELVGSLRSRGVAAELYRAGRDDGAATFERSILAWLDAHLREKPLAPQGQ